jgi:hypothetical protein
MVQEGAGGVADEGEHGLIVYRAYRTHEGKSSA